MDDKMDQLALKPGNRLDFEGSSNSYVLELTMAGGDDERLPLSSTSRSPT